LARLGVDVGDILLVGMMSDLYRQSSAHRGGCINGLASNRSNAAGLTGNSVRL